MLTQEENDFFARVGPGTPAGEFLRRYWLPVAPVSELTDERPTRFVRILGEDLVLFKDRSGRVGLLDDHCAHRGTSLLYGRVERRGIACPYHGWLYDIHGTCLETPGEPRGSHFRLTIRQQAYPVRELAGLYWAYLGTQPAPEILHLDMWARTDGRRWIEVLPDLDCNWFQVMENSSDLVHGAILHQDSGNKPLQEESTEYVLHRLEGYEGLEANEFEYGILKRLKYTPPRPSYEGPALVFPNILCLDDCTEIRVPIDDTHTYHVRVYFEPGAEPAPGDVVPVVYAEPFKAPADALHPYTRFKWWERPTRNPVQDYMAWETQCPISDRTREHLATSDRGIVLYRELVKREIEKVQHGLDPIAVSRDPDHAVIDTSFGVHFPGGARPHRGEPGRAAVARKDASVSL